MTGRDYERFDDEVEYKVITTARSNNAADNDDDWEGNRSEFVVKDDGDENMSGSTVNDDGYCNRSESGLDKMDKISIQLTQLDRKLNRTMYMVRNVKRVEVENEIDQHREQLRSLQASLEVMEKERELERRERDDIRKKQAEMEKKIDAIMNLLRGSSGLSSAFAGTAGGTTLSPTTSQGQPGHSAAADAPTNEGTNGLSGFANTNNGRIKVPCELCGKLLAKTYVRVHLRKVCKNRRMQQGTSGQPNDTMGQPGMNETDMTRLGSPSLFSRRGN